MGSIKAKLCAAAALLCCCAILLAACSPAAPRVSYTEARVVSAPVSAGSAFHSPGSSRASIAESDYLKLAVDELTGSPIITDKSTGKVWAALPEAANDAACALRVTLLTRSGVYELNSSDNSAAFGSVSITPGGTGCSVSYTLADKRETAGKLPEEVTRDDVYASVTVKYELSGQTLRASVDMSSVRTAPDSSVTSVSLLPWLGADLRPADGDYILLPDNSGAILHSNTDVTDSELVFDVYGPDPYVPGSAAATAYLPCFGVKSGDSAFCAVITGGEALAHIRADAASAGSPAGAYASFDIVRTAADEASGRLYTGAAYAGEISVAYKFLSGDSADYSGMARAAREELVHMGYIPELTSAAGGPLPVSVTTVGSYGGDNFASAQNAQSLVSSLLGRGIGSVSLYYDGALSGGITQKRPGASGFKLSLGGRRGLSDLYAFMQTRACQLYIGADMFLAASGLNDSRALYDIFGNRARGVLTDPLSAYNAGASRLSVRIGSALAAQTSGNNASMYLGSGGIYADAMRLSAVQSDFPAVLSKSFFSHSDGLEILDAGRMLASDGETDRQTCAASVRSLLLTAAERGAYALAGANAYALSGASAVSWLSFDTQYTESSAYEPVPFAQIVLHGRVGYSGRPVDAALPQYRYDMLRSIEYGASPAFLWVFNDASVFSYTYYQQSEMMPVITDFCARADELLGDLAGREILSHRKIVRNADGAALTGVYRTTYSGGSDIYVNYNDVPVTTAGNIVIGAADCVRIDR